MKLPEQTAERVIIGIDPGTVVMGYGVLIVRGRTTALVTMGVLKLDRYENHYLRLHRIYQKVLALMDEYHPDEMAIEAPFFGKNVQSMLKLGRAQGAAIAAALNREIPIFEYAPLKIKMAITGNGQASKEQVAGMLQRMLHLDEKDMPDFMDATDALAAAYCHFLQMGRPETGARHYNGWKDFVVKNKQVVSKASQPMVKTTRTHKIP